ncbi:MAG: hypothetical protein DRJ32_01250 [Thermoprotei archaeon]|nr:MAG: hypothetical protein B6U94_02275 [Thermofilum sp. ex4484_79]RLE61413.1 MAG: hypothetical protein DRJ32_01250 [Thermoprotei archaeon]
MIEVKFKAILTSKSIIKDPLGENMIKLELMEEKDIPGPVIIHQKKDDTLSREIAPVISQIMKSLPIFSGGKFTVPRLTILLTEDEWDRLPEKPEIGDIIEVVIKSKMIEIKKG